MTHLNQVKVNNSVYLYTSQAEHTHFLGTVVFCYTGVKFWFLNAHYCMGCYRPQTALWPNSPGRSEGLGSLSDWAANCFYVV